MEEVQEHLGVEYNSYRPFSSEVRAILYREGKIVGLDIAAELAYRGDEEGLIGRSREIECRCRLEGGGWKGAIHVCWQYTDGAEGEGGEITTGVSCSRECGGFSLGLSGEYGADGGGERYGGEAAISLKQEEILISLKSGVMWGSGLEEGEVSAGKKSGMTWSASIGLQLTQMSE